MLLDFDGTLVHPRRWSECLTEVLDVVVPGHGWSADAVRPFVRGRFPWHSPSDPHPELDAPDAWWASLTPMLGEVLSRCGVADTDLEAALDVVRSTYPDPARYRLFPDTFAALVELRNAGFELVVLSNHVPELPAVVDGLGLGRFVSEVYSSANTGYEKPHPEAYRSALGGEDPGGAWMVGDNPEADVRGAERCGLRALLVRAEGGCSDLVEAARRIIADH